MTDQPEPLPTFPESAPPRCRYPLADLVSCELPMGHQGMHEGLHWRWRVEGDHVDYVGPRAESPPAPRDYTPEQGRIVMLEECIRDVLHDIKTYGALMPGLIARLDLVVDAPSPAPETAALCEVCERDQSGHDRFMADTKTPHRFRPAPPAEPVEEAQRCTCGHPESSHFEDKRPPGDIAWCSECYVRQEDCEGFEPRVEVEDEGARPLVTRYAKRRPDMDNPYWDEFHVWEYGYVGNEGNAGLRYVAVAIEAAIRKEAIAAQDDETTMLARIGKALEVDRDEWRTRAEAAERRVSELERLLDTTTAARAWSDIRTRAEAAEGALRAVYNKIIDYAETLSGEQELTTLEVACMDMLARALTAKSVTPTGDA